MCRRPHPLIGGSPPPYTRTPTLLRAVDSCPSSAPTLLLVISLLLSQPCQPSTCIAAAPVHQLLLLLLAHAARALLHQPLLLTTLAVSSICALPAPTATLLLLLLLQQARAGGCNGVGWQLGNAADHKVRRLRTIIVPSKCSPLAPCCCLPSLCVLGLLLLVLRGAVCTAARLLLLPLGSVRFCVVSQAEVVCCFDQHQDDRLVLGAPVVTHTRAQLLLPAAGTVFVGVLRQPQGMAQAGKWDSLSGMWCSQHTAALSLCKTHRPSWAVSAERQQPFEPTSRPQPARDEVLGFESRVEAYPATTNPCWTVL